MPSYWFDHVHLGAGDSVKAAEFYEKRFGAKRVAARDLPGGGSLVYLDLNGTTIIIAPRRPWPVESGASEAKYVLEHFGLRTDDLEAAVAELKAEGVKFVQDITVARPGVRISFFLAPDDVLVELLERSG